jgi:hypothetical protein
LIGWVDSIVGLAVGAFVKCDKCGKSIGFEYTKQCKTCGCLHCAKCLDSEPTFSADGDYDYEGGRYVDNSSFPECSLCDEVPS